MTDSGQPCQCFRAETGTGLDVSSVWMHQRPHELEATAVFVWASLISRAGCTRERHDIVSYDLCTTRMQCMGDNVCQDIAGPS